jgi:hypothetical protein
MTPEQFKKLPSHVRNLINQLNYQVRELSTALDAVNGKPSKSVFHFRFGSHNNDRVWLPEYASLHAGDEFNSIGLRIDKEDGEPFLNFNSTGRLVLIEPRSSNSFRVKI